MRARFTTFLYPTVRNLSHRRKDRGPRWLFLDDQAVMLARAPAQGDLVEGHHTVVKLLSSLPDAQREVLLLRYVDGMILKEIALAVGIPEGTAKSRLHHALAAIRAEGRETMTTEREHLDLLRLDSLRAGEGTTADRHHVDACDLCRAELESMEKHVLAIEAAMPVPPDLPQRARQEILEAVRRGSSPRRFRFRRAMYVLPLAGAAALLAIMILLPGGENGDIERGKEPVVDEAPVGRPALDVNGDGFLDSGDVEELARIIRGGTGAADRWDFNGDGKADGADVDFLSREIGTDSDETGIE